MLAPLFDEVEERFSVYVFELRQILKLHNLPVAGDGALPAIANSLAKSPTLRLSMGRMVRAMIRREREQISSVELLAVLMRAAGHSPAEHSDTCSENAVEELLGFILEIRYPHETAEESTSPLIAPTYATQPNGRRLPLVAPPLERPAASLFEESEDHEGSRKRIVLIAACVTLLAVAVPVAHYKPGGSQKGANIVASGGRTAGAAAERKASGPDPSRTASGRGMFGRRSASLAEDVRARVTDSPETARVASVPVVGRGSAPTETTGNSEPVQPVRLGTDAVHSVEPSGPIAAPTNHRIVPVDLGIRGSATRQAGVPAGGAGFVHAASAGIMAGNVISSPAPPYPAEALSAGVEGEVMLRAVVGRDGNVTEARVVSGPPLLRQAAMQAVEQWQYRPYLVHGKPAAIGTTAIVEFKLPSP